MSRGFNIVDESVVTILPQRMTKNSAGYDFYLPNDITLLPNSTTLCKSNISAYMESDEVLLLFIRSSLANKQNITLKNQVGVIDSDFFPNEIVFILQNATNNTIILCKDTRVVQGVFTKYLLADNDCTLKDRKGGIGSTDGK
jgi:dUTP pyrophosphatase